MASSHIGSANELENSGSDSHLELTLELLFK